MPLIPYMKDLWTLQFASGLHAERNWVAAGQKLLPVSPNLALLGNIGNLSRGKEAKETRRFFEYAKETWEKVYWVPGPYEYSSLGSIAKDMFKLRDEIQTLVGDKLIVLDQTEVELPNDIVILGATGWVKDQMPLTDPLWLTDQKGQRRADSEYIADLCDQDVRWLKDRIEWWGRVKPGKRLVILTHNCPLHDGSLMDGASSIRGAEPLLKHPVAMWLAGTPYKGTNPSGNVGKTFMAINDTAAPGYLCNRSVSLPIYLR